MSKPKRKDIIAEAREQVMFFKPRLHVGERAPMRSGTHNELKGWWVDAQVFVSEDDMANLGDEE